MLIVNKVVVYFSNLYELPFYIIVYLAGSSLSNSLFVELVKIILCLPIII